MSTEPGVILLVEDNPDHAELTMDAIKRCALPATVVWVSDGEGALDYLYRRGCFADRDGRAPALCLLDLKLPGIDGLAVLKAIREDDALASMPVVILTTSRRLAEAAAAYLAHANSYVIKPMDFEAFHKRVQELTLYWTLTNHTPTDQA